MKNIKKINISEAVSEQLLALISTGEIKVGGKLPSESQLCQMLGVSRTAIREGIKALSGINVLTVSQGRGTFVNENPGIMVKNDALNIALDRETVHSIYEVRSVLDMGIAKYAAQKATEEDIQILRKALRKMEKSLESDPADVRLATEGDEEFHLALCEAARNKILQNMAWPVINHAVLRIWKQMKTSYDTVKGAVEGHRAILEAIERRDALTAMDAVERHLKKAFETIYTDK